MWVCPFCATRNHFPHHYADINETNLPAELIPQFTTIEYQLQRPYAPAPVFVLVVDTSVKEKELQALKDSLLMALNLIPENARVALITFGATVQVHEIASEEMPKCFVFRGSKDVSTQVVQDFLGLGPRGMKGANPDQVQLQGEFMWLAFMTVPRGLRGYSLVRMCFRWGAPSSP